MPPTLRAGAWRAMAAVEGFAEGSSIFSEDDAVRADFVDGRQVAHLTDDGVELRLTRAGIRPLRERLRADERVTRRPSSDWIGVRVAGAADVGLVLELAGLTAGANRPPPTGAELARRRRFH